MEEKILSILEEVCEDDVVREDMDIELFEEELLDSMDFAQLLVLVEEQLGVVISPSGITREEVSTPNKIIDYVKAHM